METNQRKFLTTITSEIRNKKKHTKLSVEKLARQFAILDKTEAKELTELAIVNISRSIASNHLKDIKERFAQILDLYKSQVNLSHRTSQSMLLQQYSTPAPIGFLAGIFCDPLQGKSLFEPSAGNGLLTIAWKPEQCYVNEIDPLRRSNLVSQGYAKVFDQDATADFEMGKYGSFFSHTNFDAVITNPPFGKLDTAVNYNDFPIRTLEHHMAINALLQLKPDGKAAIIIGGHTKWDKKGRVQAGKNRLFFNYLYHFFNVVDLIHIDGHALYSRMGTAFDTRLILIDGRKTNPLGYAPLLKSMYADPEMRKPVKDYWQLYDRVIQYTETKSDMKKLELEAEALKLELELSGLHGLEGPYMPSSESCIVLDTQVPDSMDYETHQALARITEAIGGNIDNYVLKKLGYKSHIELCKSLAAEQVDTVGMAIYNIEEKEQAIIIGDQTGIGKGRQAAAMVLYAIKQGLKPIFLTEKANLFSDLYRDMKAIGAGKYVPFIINAKDAKSTVKDESGETVYTAPDKGIQETAFRKKQVPNGYDYIMATYSQFNKNKIDDNGVMLTDKKGLFLYNLAMDNILIMDESHNSSGTSNTGMFLQKVLALTKGVVFLSATFAKRPDNMPVYAMKTAMMDANMTKTELVEAILKGGVALQEIMASQLVEEGQMIRRERSFEGVEVNYITLDEKAAEHSAIADAVTGIIREIIDFQTVFVGKVVDELDDIAAAQGQEVETRGGTAKGGVDNTPYFSKIFNVINQMLFSIKAEEVADRAILRLKEGKKPVIAFSSTMGSFLDDMGVAPDDVIEADFSYVLKKGLDGVMRITETLPDGKKVYKSIDPNELGDAGKAKYMELLNKIDNLTSGISISPIDVIRQKIEGAGYNVAEVTGRKYELQLNRYGATLPDKKPGATGKKKEDGIDKLQLSDIPAIVKKVMPEHQQLAIVGSQEHWKILEDMERTFKSIPKIGSLESRYNKWKKEAQTNTDYKDFATAKLRYWVGNTDFYITEWDGEDEVYCYVVLNGDYQNAEFGYNSLEYIKSLSVNTWTKIEMDFFWDEKTINEAIRDQGGLSGIDSKPEKALMALVQSRKKIPVNEAFRKFNDNEYDVLMINQSGSTGASAHAITTPKVDKRQVRQRVMIVNQPELNINTEVQKRGRINRTGQILKPIYDYVNSAIPAEQRLMMMLKKKLKSLDANTSSNQKQSKEILDVPDFLNKYGDQVVLEYLIENPKLNKQLGDPLKLSDKGKPQIVDNWAHKTSGRVAILPARIQKEFYDEIINRYIDYVEYLKQTGEYDLEVETLNLEAKTINKQVVKVGKSPDSVFGEDSILETVEANVLKKPFKKDELVLMIKQALGDKNGNDIRDEMKEKHNAFMDNKINVRLAELTTHIEELIKDIPNEKKYLKADNKATYTKEREAYLRESLKNLIEYHSRVLNEDRKDMTMLMDFFTIGRVINYPWTNYAGSRENITGVCLGIHIDLRRKNPYAPSAIKIKFALASSLKYIAITAGPKFTKQLSAIKGESYYINERQARNTIETWNEIIAESSVNRNTRHIVTGNLLQAYADYKGNLVSFTTDDGSEKKGILMANEWIPKQGGESISVPIIKAAKFIKSLTVGTPIFTNGKVGIFKQPGTYKIFVPGSKIKGGKYFLDKDLLALVQNGKFEKVSDQMIATMDDGHIDELIELLQRNHSASVELNKDQYLQIADTLEKPKPKKVMELPKKEDNEDVLILELEAEALALELELLKAA